MMQHRICHLGVALALFFYTTPRPLHADELPTAEQLSAKLTEALSPPVVYRARVGRFESTVSIKKLPDGTVAVRTEACPPSQTVVLELGGHFYDVLPQSRAVIDKKLLSSSGVNDIVAQQNELSKSFVMYPPPQSAIENRQVAIGRRGEVECYELVTNYASSQLKVARRLPEALQRALVSSHVVLFDKASLQPLEVAARSLTGATLTRLEILELHRDATIADDLFALPADFKIHTPATRRDYFALHKGFWKDLAPAPPWQPAFLAASDDSEEQSASLKNSFEELRRRSTDKAPPPVPDSNLPEKQAEAGIAAVQSIHDETWGSSRGADSAHDSKGTLQDSRSSLWRALVLSHLAIFAAGALYFLIRRLRRSSA